MFSSNVTERALSMKKIAVSLAIAVLHVYGGPIDDLARGLQNITAPLPPVFKQSTEYTLQPTKGAAQPKLFIRQGDMFAQGAQAIVNAANVGLHGGGGVDMAVENAAKKYSGIDTIVKDHWAAGKPKDWGTGKAFLNTSDAMRVAFDNEAGDFVDKPTAEQKKSVNVMRVIQAAAPICGKPLKPQDKTDLNSVFKNSLKAADDNKLESVALPFLGGGIFECDTPEGAEAALRGVVEYLFVHAATTNLREVYVMLWSDAHFKLFHDAMQKLLKGDYKNIFVDSGFVDL